MLALRCVYLPYSVRAIGAVRRSMATMAAVDVKLTALAAVRDPETKRHIIGEQFVVVQERILSLV